METGLADGSAPAVAVWCSPEQAELVARVAASGLVRLVGVCAAEPVHTQGLARALGIAPIDDPRRLGAEPSADVLWLAADADLPVETRRLLLRRAPSVCLAPQPATVAEAVADARSNAGPLPRPALRSDAPLLALTGLLEAFGEVRALGLERSVAPELGGLGGALLDLAQVAAQHLGALESIGAVRVADGAVMGDRVRRAGGTLALHGRAAGGRAASALLVAAPAPRRSLTLAGPAGVLRLDETAIRWHDAGGRLVDESEAPPPDPPLEIARGLARAARGEGEPGDAVSLLAVVEAAWLAQRTGQVVETGAFDRVA